MAVRMMIIDTENYNPAGNPAVRELTPEERSYLIPDGASYADTARMVTTWEGCVLKLRERNMYHDSDFYAMVWDASRNDGAGGPREVEYGTTRFPTNGNDAWVDATEDVKAAYAAWETAYRAERQKERDAAEAATPRPGKTVVVTGGRKLPKGTKGVVFWYGEDKYNSNRWLTAYRVGIRVDDKKVFLNADHVKVDQPTD